MSYHPTHWTSLPLSSHATRHPANLGSLDGTIAQPLQLSSHSVNQPIPDSTPCGVWPPKIEFSVPGSEIAAAVVRAVGLNDKVAMVLDMDAKTKDIRFGCSFCSPLKRMDEGRVLVVRIGMFLPFDYYFSTIIRFLLGITLHCEFASPRTPSPSSLQMG